ncbi:MAG: hypothetical protein ACXWPM_09855 [Bdellovibrionota bacterium]
MQKMTIVKNALFLVTLLVIFASGCAHAQKAEEATSAPAPIAVETAPSVDLGATSSGRSR